MSAGAAAHIPVTVGPPTDAWRRDRRFFTQTVSRKSEQKHFYYANRKDGEHCSGEHQFYQFQM